MSGAYLLVTIILYLRAPQGQSYKLHAWKSYGDVYTIEIYCDDNERLDSSRPTKDSESNINETIIAAELKFWNCAPPKKSYLEILKEIYIDASRVTMVSFSEMTDTYLLTESLFEGMPLRNLKINNYIVSINPTKALDLAQGTKHILYCYYNKDILINEKTVLPTRELNVSVVIFHGCTPRNESYFDMLGKLNINPASVQEMELHDPDPLKPDNFKGLSLHKLSVLFSYDDHMDPNVFEEIAADEVYLEHVVLKTLSKFRAKKASLRDGEFVGEWGDCSILTALELNGVKIPKVPGGWLHRCRKLTDLTLNTISHEGVKESFKGARALTNLSVSRCNYDALMDTFAVDSVNLRRLQFVNHKLSYIKKDVFSTMENLEDLDISDNRLSGLQIFQAVTSLKNLRKLTIDSNPLENFCNDYFEYTSVSDTVFMLGIESVFLRHTPLSFFCFDEWRNLTYLDLSYNVITVLQLGGLPIRSCDDHPLTVDLRGNQLDTPMYSELQYADSINRLHESQNITILLDWKIECDCEHSSFVKDLRKLPHISLQNATCKSGESLVDFTGEKFGCVKYTCDECTCRTSLDDNTTIAYCDSMGLDAFPEIWKFQRKKSTEEIIVKKILASNNSIQTLPKYEYPRSLVEIDLRNNIIIRISESALNALFADETRQVNLSGNPFLCDCETQAMLDLLSAHRGQIPDYEYIKCSNRNYYLHELSDRSLCTERILLNLGIVSASLLATAAVITLLYFRYKLTIKAFLYARGLCLTCVREEELDADKEYDAFISFSNKDDELVAEELLPGLENDYKLYLHTRDWMPGEMIYTQIVKSVQQSRRTIIVLTKNFVESVWAMLEFRTAYVIALREGRVRVICIVVDDIDEMDLAPDLKAYLKSNTYLNLRDPWFWQKLRYVLPHRCDTNESGSQIESGENRCQEIELAFR